jgi:hypothetical protein
MLRIRARYGVSASTAVNAFRCPSSACSPIAMPVCAPTTGVCVDCHLPTHSSSLR